MRPSCRVVPTVHIPLKWTPIGTLAGFSKSYEINCEKSNSYCVVFRLGTKFSSIMRYLQSVCRRTSNVSTTSNFKLSRLRTPIKSTFPSLRRPRLSHLLLDIFFIIKRSFRAPSSIIPAPTINATVSSADWPFVSVSEQPAINPATSAVLTRKSIMASPRNNALGPQKLQCFLFEFIRFAASSRSQALLERKLEVWVALRYPVQALVYTAPRSTAERALAPASRYVWSEPDSTMRAPALM